MDLLQIGRQSISSSSSLGLGGRKSLCSHLPIPERAPWMTFSYGQQREEWTFYSVRNKCHETRIIPGIGNTDLLRYSDGWFLLCDRSSGVCFLFDLTSLESIPIPPIEDHVNFIFFFSQPPSHPDCSLICIHRHDPYFLIFNIGDSNFTKHEFHFVDPDEHICCAIGHQGKVYAKTALNQLLIIDPVLNVMIEYIKMKDLPHDGLSYSFELYLVEARGDIFLVQLNAFRDSDIWHHIEVSMLNFSDKVWLRVDTIGDLVFFLGSHYSVACSASEIGIKGDRIYYIDVTDERLCCFDLDYGSLTVDFPLPPYERQIWSDAPQWVLVNQDMGQQSGKDCLKDQHQDEDIVMSPLQVQGWYFNRGEDSIRSQPLFDFIHLEKHSPRRCSLETPWLMVTHKNNGIYKLVDPVSSKTCTLSIPELSGSVLYFSRDGWLLVHKTRQIMFLFNPFTNDKVDLPVVRRRAIYGICFSCTPTSPDCMVFGINNSYEDQVELCFYRHGDQDWTELVFQQHDHSFRVAHGNPVFHNGYFYCLALDGSLGVFDPEKLTWVVLSLSRDFDFDVQRCFLLESVGELLSFFMDEFDYPHGQFRLDADSGRWIEVSSFEGRSLFVGQTGSLSVPAPNQDMKDVVCLPKFVGEFNYNHPVMLGLKVSGDSDETARESDDESDESRGSYESGDSDKYGDSDGESGDCDEEFISIVPDVYYKYTEYLLNIWVELPKDFSFQTWIWPEGSACFFQVDQESKGTADPLKDCVYDRRLSLDGVVEKLNSSRLS